jgi:hypothetical protein
MHSRQGGLLVGFPGHRLAQGDQSGREGPVPGVWGARPLSEVVLEATREHLLAGNMRGAKSNTANAADVDAAQSNMETSYPVAVHQALDLLPLAKHPP